jgi:hypothetical protein
MAPRRNTQTPQDNTPDYLVKPKAQFEADLDERIKLGEDLLNKVIQNQTDHSFMIDEHDHWHDYSSELINRAFNNLRSQYYIDYSRMLPMNINALNLYYSPTFAEKVAETKDGIKEHIDRLKKIKAKLMLIDELPILKSTPKKEVTKQVEGLRYLSNLFSKFHRVAQQLRHRHADRDTLFIKDE